MKKSRFSEEQIAYALRQVESGTPVGDVCRQVGVSEATFYTWKKKFAHLGVSELRRLRQLEETLDLRGRVERHPYGMVLAAMGAGYVLGGGLFTPFTGRMVRLGLKLAALPLVKDELLGIAEAAVDRYVASAPPPGPEETDSGSTKAGGGAR